MNTLIFDIGKTNKKLLVFDEDLKIILEESIQFKDVKDEDGFTCDDLNELNKWIIEQFKIQNSKFKISRVNFSAYGASWVHLDEKGKPITPLYNYLKPFPKELEKQFDEQYGLEKVARETGSPYSGMLNSGLQLYWLKYAKPEVFEKIKHSLHLPQYLSNLITDKPVSEYTSIGCHTMLWDYNKHDYRSWVYAEGIDLILPPIVDANHTEIIKVGSSQIEAGPGIHDSSASLFPYFKKSKEPFMLLSTGTWCVAMNPFYEFKERENSKFKDQLFYMTIEGKPVKATRLMLGKEYEEGISEIANEMGQPKFKIQSLKGNETLNFKLKTLNSKLVKKQVSAILEAKGNSTMKTLYIEGGFTKNEMFLSLLKQELTGWEIIKSENTNGTAVGAAMVIAQVR
ncbi:MAG: carbohydrate kinase [Bacteroidia bacterium]